MSDLQSTVAAALIDRYLKNAARVRDLAAPLTNAQFWQKPFPTATASVISFFTSPAT